MITYNFNRKGLDDKWYIVKALFVNGNEEIVALNELLDTKLAFSEVATVLRANLKDGYKLLIVQVKREKRFPSGYYESFSIDEVASHLSRIRFVEVKRFEVPKLVYVNKIVETEL